MSRRPHHDDPERRERRERRDERRRRRRGPSAFTVILILLLIIAALVALMLFTNGFGFGSGGSFGIGTPNSPTSSSTESAAEVSAPSVEELKYLEVKVSENEYLYNNSKLTLEELTEKLKTDVTEGTCVKVTDESASKRAYDDLIKSLKDNNIKFIEEQ